ncbi:MAG TPA: HAD-IIIA family hydrolase [Burkholderiaceae bacterium]
MKDAIFTNRINPSAKLPPRLHVVIDRDGTLVRHVPYLCAADQVQLLPTVAAGVAHLADNGCQLYLHTNQSGVGRGYFALADVHACNEEMLLQIGLGADIFQEICIAPETPEQSAVYRKPSPRFGLELIARHQIDAGRICYLGDNVTDMATAQNIGCLGVGINTGVHDLRRAVEIGQIPAHFPVFDDFLSAAIYLTSMRAN